MKFALYVALAVSLMACSVPTSSTHFLALGDSYTIGEGVTASERWPEKLVEDLKNRGLILDSLQIIAQTGWTTDELLLGVLESPVLPAYDLVTVMVGVNNQYRGRSLENFRNELAILLEKSIDYAGKEHEKVFVISIPDWGVTPFAGQRDKVKIASEIDAFNAEIKKLCESFQLRYIDVTEISRKAAQDPTLLADDGLHPSGLMYAQWVEKMAPIIFETLHD
ncbi:MAG: SGNH/GDSL hydrolase family protein [Flavobacteriaceae bacterium]